MVQETSPCRHFLQGRCTFGDACSFSHGVASSPQPWVRIEQPERDVCRHFLEGRCTYGSLCKFQHPEEENRSLCRHFIEGRCTFGDLCRFSHGGQAHVPVPVPVPVKPPKRIPVPIVPPAWTKADDRPVCRHFLEGRCNYGDNCRFSHEGDVDLHPPVATPMAPADPTSDRPTCRHFLAGTCSYGAACRFSHADQNMDSFEMEAEAPVDDRPICRHFLQGKCSFGSECRFSHSVDFILDPAVAAAVAPPSGGYDTGLAAEEVKSVCRHFIEGKCSYGDFCRFAHPGEAPPEPKAWQQKPMPTQKADGYGPVRTQRAAPTTSPIHFETRTCRHFLAGKCTYGDLCTFLHPGEPPVKETVAPWKQQALEGQDFGPLNGHFEQESRQVCRHFLVGRCNYGSNCSFSHNVGSGGG